MNWLFGIYAVMSLVTGLAYWLDKRLAQGGGRRLSERTLHLLALARFYPDRFQAKRRIFGGDTLCPAVNLTRIDRHFALGIDLGAANIDPHQINAVLIGLQIKVVAYVHRGHQKAQILR